MDHRDWVSKGMHAPGLCWDWGVIGTMAFGGVKVPGEDDWLLGSSCFLAMWKCAPSVVRPSHLKKIVIWKNIIKFIYFILFFSVLVRWLPRWLSSKESACHAEDAGDLGSTPGWRRSPGGGHDNPLQYSCLENPMDRGAWWAIVHRVTRVGHD